MKILLLAVALLASTSLCGQTVVVDPGHPSEIGPGTKGKRISEMKAVWLVALELRSLLEAKGYRVIFTKTKLEQKVTNKARADIANKSNADLMVRLHCDYAPGESGFGTYYADRQGRDGKVTGPSADVLKRVRPMANAFHGAVMQSLGTKLSNRGVKTDRQTKVGGERGALIGSIHSRVPSLLVEMAVLNHDADDRFIASKEGRRALAIALAAGVEAALRSDPSKVAQKRH